MSTKRTRDDSDIISEPEKRRRIVQFTPTSPRSPAAAHTSVSTILPRTPSGGLTRRRSASAPLPSSQLSEMDPTPKRRGRPTIRKPTGEERKKTKERRKADRLLQKEAVSAQKKAEAEAEKIRARASALEQEQADEDSRVWTAFQALRADAKEGGYGFGTFYRFMSAVWSSKNPLLSSAWSKFCQAHGEELMDQVHTRAPDVADSWMMEKLLPTIRKEGAD